MSKRLRSYVVAIMAMLFAFAIVAVPQKAWAVENGTIYNKDGISVSIIDRYDALIPKSVNVDLVIDGETVVNDHEVSDLPAAAAGAQLQINAPGYYVEWETTNGLTVAPGRDGYYNLGFGIPSSYDLTVKLTKTSADIELGEYGTFSWSKPEATNFDHERQVKIRVNGEDTGEVFIVKTPDELHNTDASNQFWFSSNLTKYNSAVEINPPLSLTGTTNDITIDLTTRCQCGKATCVCPGGSGCSCIGGCGCDDCTGVSLGENAFSTGYGVITYVPQTDNGYKLDVELYVNGQKVWNTESPIYVENNRDNTLKFTPGNGVYFFGDEAINSYDIITLRGTGTWRNSTGLVTFGGDSQNVREYDNVLKIYAYTFQNYLSLNVHPRVAVNKLVSNYIISYEAADPINGGTRTYEYKATAIDDLAQTQIIPKNTPVTLTAICDEGYEAKKWSTLDGHDDGISLTGNRGSETGTAYGDIANGSAATLTVNSSTHTLVTVFIEEVGKAGAPSVDEVKDALGGIATIDCTNLYVNHENDPYEVELQDDSITIGEVANNSVSVTLGPASYVDIYNSEVATGHKLVDGQTFTYTLTHDGQKWVEATGAKVTINVDCGAEPEPEEPGVPTDDVLSNLLEGKVTVTCTNGETAHGSKAYGLLEDSYTKDEAIKEGINGYTYNIVISAEKYVGQFGVDKGLVHLPAEDQIHEIPVSFVYDSGDNAWKLADVSTTVNIDVTCVSAPDFDDINAAYPNGLVEVECTNVKSGHEPKTYGAMDGGTILNGTLSYGNGTYNYTFEVSPWAYVQKYSFDCDSVFHYGQLKSKTVAMTYDFNKNAWTVVDNTPIKFEVECDLTSGEDVPTLTEDDIKTLLWDSVTINCVNSDADHNPLSKTYGVADVEGGYKLLGIGSNGTNYTATIEIYAGQFINKFESESGVLHGLAEGENDTKTVMLVCDENKWIADNAKVTFEVVCNDKPVQTAGTIIVTPADITIYQGAKNGYEAVVGENGETAEMGENALPEPLFKVESSTGEIPEDIEFYNNYNVWTLENKGNGYYRFVNEGKGDPVRIQFTDAASGNTIVSSDFDPFYTGDSYRQLTISIYPGESGSSSATAMAGDAPYAVNTGTGTLTVRAVADDNAVALIENDVPTGDELDAADAVAVEPENGTTYTLNNTGVALDDDAEPSLLFDSIIDKIEDSDTTRTQLLENEIDAQPGIDSGFQSEIKYLDLVDANNGNAWIKSSNGVDIYWDYPDGTDQSTEFKVMHFSGLHRDGAESGFDPEDIDGATIENVTIDQTPDGITFHVDEGNFSPYALVWDYEDNGGTTPGGDGGTTTKYYEIEASAGEGGSISPSGTVKVAAGTDKTFTFTADEGYSIGSVIVDGVNYRQVSSYTFEDVDEDHTISVTFMRGNDPANPDDTGVSDWLETDDHIVFLHGYGDGSGTFGPENQMTRAEVAQMFYNLLLDKSRGDKPVNFTDVPADAYYAEPVFTLASLGIVNGTSPETFEPNRPITRAEFVAIAMRFTNGEFEGENLFVDVPEDAWYRDYVVGAVGYGWIYGYQDGSQKFGPLDTITRGQATMVTNRMLWRACDTVWAMEHMDQLKTFVDLGQSHYAFFDVVEATNAHDYTRVGDTRYENWTGLVK